MVLPYHCVHLVRKHHIVLSYHNDQLHSDGTWHSTSQNSQYGTAAWCNNNQTIQEFYTINQIEIYSVTGRRGLSNDNRAP